MTELAYDLFGGARGWEADLDALDELRTIGFELDADACATSRAAGMHTVQDDVARLVPAVVALVYGRPDGIIASPPCQLFSGAGKGTGRLLMEELHRAITDAARGASDVVMARHRRRSGAASCAPRPTGWPATCRSCGSRRGGSPRCARGG